MDPAGRALRGPGGPGGRPRRHWSLGAAERRIGVRSSHPLACKLNTSPSSVTPGRNHLKYILFSRVLSYFNLQVLFW